MKFATVEKWYIHAVCKTYRLYVCVCVATKQYFSYIIFISRSFLSCVLVFFYFYLNILYMRTTQTYILFSAQWQSFSIYQLKVYIVKWAPHYTLTCAMISLRVARGVAALMLVGPKPSSSFCALLVTISRNYIYHRRYECGSCTMSRVMCLEPERLFIERIWSNDPPPKRPPVYRYIERQNASWKCCPTMYLGKKFASVSFNRPANLPPMH